MKGKIQFKEEQSFKNTWMFYLVIGVSVLAVAGTVVPIWTNGDTEAIIALAISASICIGLVVLFTFSKLTTTIDDRAIYYRYPPFVNKEKKLTHEDLAEVFVRKYRPIWEYGGWGYRRRPGKGKALNVSGNKGLQIVTKDGKKLLIGTQKAEDLERAIARLKDNWKELYG